MVRRSYHVKRGGYRFFEVYFMEQIGFWFLSHFITYYGLMIVIGILVNIPISYLQIKRFGLVANDFIIICAFSALLSIICAKILYLITSYKHIIFTKLNDWSYINSLMNGGFVFLGGIVGLLIALYICNKYLDISVQSYIQACIACLPFGHAFGRIGCFLVGCCYGIPYEGWLSITYTDSQFAPVNVELFPVQLVEAFIELMLGIVLLIFSKKLRYNSGLYLYLLIYSICRFCLEFFRYDEIRSGIAFMSTSQILCIILFCVTSFYLIKDFRKNT